MYKKDNVLVGTPPIGFGHRLPCVVSINNEQLVMSNKQ